MIIYKGYRKEPENFASDNVILVSADNGETWANLPWGLEWVNHSPTGLNWGYHGSGYAQLAFAILHDFFQRAFKYSAEKAYKEIENGGYQEFKRAFVSRWGALS